MTPSIDRDYAECERVLAASGSTFAVPIRLLPTPKRRATAALYAFCRRVDDAADAAVGQPPQPDKPGHDPGHDPRGELARMRRDLEDALVGGGREPIHRAVADAARRFGIPRDLLFDVIDGVEMDLDPRGFETFADLEEYCRRVASSVGIAAIHIWGYRSELAIRPAHACGVAFQLTNILRDFREDADAGRVYLPEQDLRECGVERAEILARPARASIGAGIECALARIVDRAAGFYAEAASLDSLLSTDGRMVFRGMLGAYGAIYRRIAGRIGRLAEPLPRTWKTSLAAAALATIVLGPSRLRPSLPGRVRLAIDRRPVA